jgi:hypothetical protein
MSQILIRAALETALAAITPALATSWENVAFSPPASSVPYQRAFLMFAEPDNSEFGSAHREQGVFQVSLMYPLQAGDGAVRARAELIRRTFYRGSSFTNGGVTVSVTHTPEIGAGTVDGDRWFVPVKSRFISNIIA